MQGTAHTPRRLLMQLSYNLKCRYSVRGWQ